MAHLHTKVLADKIPVYATDCAGRKREGLEVLQVMGGEVIPTAPSPFLDLILLAALLSTKLLVSFAGWDGILMVVNRIPESVATCPLQHPVFSSFLPDKQRSVGLESRFYSPELSVFCHSLPLHLV